MVAGPGVEQTGLGAYETPVLPLHPPAIKPCVGIEPTPSMASNMIPIIVLILNL